MQIIKFDTRLIGSTMDSGYKITIEKDCKAMDIINFLCNNFGEGDRKNDYEVSTNEWAFVESRPNRKVVLLNSLDKLELFCKHFNISLEIDDSQTINSIVYETLRSYILEPITTKNVNRIREKLSKKFHIKPFAISIDKMIKSISIDLGYKKIEVSIS